MLRGQSGKKGGVADSLRCNVKSMDGDLGLERPLARLLIRRKNAKWIDLL